MVRIRPIVCIVDHLHLFIFCGCCCCILLWLIRFSNIHFIQIIIDTYTQTLFILYVNTLVGSNTCVMCMFYRNLFECWYASQIIVWPLTKKLTSSKPKITPIFLFFFSLSFHLCRLCASLTSLFKYDSGSLVTHIWSFIYLKS